MEDYKNNLKNYSKKLYEKSILLKLLNSKQFSSIKNIREEISKCQWNDTEEIGNIYNFDKEEIFKNYNIFVSERELSREFRNGSRVQYQPLTVRLHDIGNNYRIHKPQGRTRPGDLAGDHRSHACDRVCDRRSFQARVHRGAPGLTRS